jgi:hypothetical protein
MEDANESRPVSLERPERADHLALGGGEPIIDG